MNDALVLCYHALSESWPADLSTTPALFEAQLGLLLERGYRPVTFEQAVSAPPGSRTFAVTFDDAYRSVLERAQPIMARMGVPGKRVRAHRFRWWPATDGVAGHRPVAGRTA